MEFARIRTRLSPRRTVVTPGRSDPKDGSADSDVIDTVGRTQQIPIVGTSPKVEHDVAAAETSEEVVPGAGSPPRTPPQS